ncbi:hypothetical protein AAG570_007296 [Ranatra chinensis]|uniref:PB1 domain-containing protein n=1 Tax=Ranatra chinensis TaxID=642074 RepID=A0ABD0YJ82_9HEMI
MSRHSKKEQRVESGFVEVKTKFDAEFRRFSLPRNSTTKYEELRSLLERLHGLQDTAFLISYTDPRDGDLLPINNDDNLTRAIQNARPLLRVIIQRKVCEEVFRRTGNDFLVGFGLLKDFERPDDVTGIDRPNGRRPLYSGVQSWKGGVPECGHVKGYQKEVLNTMMRVDGQFAKRCPGRVSRRRKKRVEDMEERQGYA